VYNPHDLPWFRQNHESWQAYEAFALYRDLGKARNHAKVAQAVGKNVSLIRRWSSRWTWLDRAASFDANEDFERMVHMRERRYKWIEDDLEIAHKMQSLISDALLTLDPKQLSANALIRWFDVTSKIQTRILGLTPQQMEEQVATQASQQTELEKLMEDSPEVADAVLDALQSARNVRDTG